MPGYLIKDTTREERKKIVEESLGNTSANCDGCMAGLEEMYKTTLTGKKRSVRSIWSSMRGTSEAIWKKRKGGVVHCKENKNLR